MAISTFAAAIPHVLIIPAYSKLSGSSRNKAHPKSNVAALSTRSDKLASSLIPFAQPKVPNPIPVPPLKANRSISLHIMRSISEKDDEEILADLNRLQNLCKMMRRFLGEIILVLMATNPIMLHLVEATMVHNPDFVCCSHVAAAYGALIVSKECVKVLWKAQPIWGLIMLGFLIYKANMCNIAMFRKGHYPLWLGPPLTALFIGKAVTECFILWTRTTKLAPLNRILVFIDIIASLLMAICSHEHYVETQESANYGSLHYTSPARSL